MQNENIETLNERLRLHYGIDTITGLPMWRIVWANGQVEKRMSKFTATGIELLQPEVQELPKYPWIRDCHVLEQLVLIPEVNRGDLPGQRLSYEPFYPFKNKQGETVPPAWWAIKFIIDTMYAAKGRKSLAKYLMAPGDPTNPITSKRELYEHHKAEIQQIETELYGDESGLGGVTHNASGSGIIMPSNYKRSE